MMPLALKTINPPNIQRRRRDIFLNPERMIIYQDPSKPRQPINTLLHP